MKIVQTSFVIALSSLLSLFSHANTTNTLAQASQIQQSLPQHTQIKPTENKQIEDKWSEWGLTQEEWAKYEELMKGSRGIWSPNLDPLTALGVEAKTETERRRFAELLAKKEYERVEKEFAFQIAYTQAFERLYPNQLPFRQDENNGSISMNTQRVIYFTKIDCAKCSQDIPKLLSHIQSTPVDIYVVDSAGDDNKIRQWALKNHIDVAKVRSRQITLNHDNGYWLQYAKGKMPVAFQVNGDGQWQQIYY